MRNDAKRLDGWKRCNLAAAVATAMAVLAACGGNDAPPPADTVLTNGYVYTVNAKDDVAQAVAVRDGKIVYVGDDAGAKAYVGAGTRSIDLGGRMLMPGLVDGHAHTLEGGANTLKCDMNYLPLTIAQMRDSLQTCLDATRDKEPDNWLEVVNWDRQFTSTADRDPVHGDIDGLDTQRPIFITSIDGHSFLINARAIAKAGITAAMPDPSDGHIAKDAEGNPTGILEDGAWTIVQAVMPPITDADRLQHGRIALDLLRRQGVTSFMDAWAFESTVKTFATLADSGELTARAEMAMLITPEEAARPVQTLTALKDIAKRYARPAQGAAPTVEVRHVKFSMDGVLQAPAMTAGTLAPYNIDIGTDEAPKWVPGTNSGTIYFSAELIDNILLEAVKAGFDPHMHAIGDATVRRALDAVEFARKALPGNAFRPAIAHVELADPSDYGRFKSLGVYPVMSFQWAQRAPFSIEAVEPQLGPERFDRMEPEGSLVAAGATLAYGSDWPIDPMAYFYNLRVGVTRSGDPNHLASAGPAYAGRLNNDPLLSRAMALRSITMNSALQLKLDDKVGSIETGKFADLIVLDRNFLSAPEDKLAFTQVLLTMSGGKVVWADAPFAASAAAGKSAPERMQALDVRKSVGHAVTSQGDGHRH